MDHGLVRRVVLSFECAAAVDETVIVWAVWGRRAAVTEVASGERRPRIVAVAVAGGAVA